MSTPATRVQQTDWGRCVRERIYHALENAHTAGQIKGELAHLQKAGRLAAAIAVREINILIQKAEDE